MREDVQDAVSRVDEDRLWQRHMEMARSAPFRATASIGGVSKEDIAARKILAGVGGARNFDVTADGIGNLFVRPSRNGC